MLIDIEAAAGAIPGKHVFKQNAVKTVPLSPAGFVHTAPALPSIIIVVGVVPLPKPVWLNQVCQGLSNNTFPLGAMAAAADFADATLRIVICSYTNHTIGLEHRIALLRDPVRGNRVNFLGLPPLGWTRWHGGWICDHRTGQLSMQFHHAAGQLPLRQVTTWRISDRTLHWTHFQGYDSCMREITMRPLVAYTMYRGGQAWHELELWEFRF